MKRAALLLAIAPVCVAFALFGPQMAGRALLSLGFATAAARIFDDPAWKGAALYAASRWGEAADAFANDPASDYNLGNALARAGRFDEAIAAFGRALAAHPDDGDAAFNKALLEAALQREPKPASGGAEGVVANSPGFKAGGSRDRPPTEGKTSGYGEGLASGRETQSETPAAGGAAKEGKGGGAPAGGDRAAAGGAASASEGAGRSGDMNALVAELLRERESRVRRRLQIGGVHPSLEWLQTLPDDPGRFLKLRILAEKARRLRAAGGPVPEDD
ncbi:tetratricopeptide repeat protein [Methylocystis sp. JAN1]|uniref:tetratricopeptide repeat protein n=1 Tax=Methylocystis sp. JAN1 TaxID=3397211 RepID=UPI003FA21F41